MDLKHELNYESHGMKITKIYEEQIVLKVHVWVLSTDK